MNTDVRIIKRYQNRKLYDTYQSCYVTLEEISHIVRKGNDIKVIDNKTKNDITYMTQIQLLFDQERKASKVGDTELLKRVIRSNDGTLTSYIKQLEQQYGLASNSNIEFDASDNIINEVTKDESSIATEEFTHFIPKTDMNRTNSVETSNTLN